MPPTTASDSVATRLSAELERALIRELLEAWNTANRADFAGELRPPTLALHEAGALGRFHPSRRALTLQRGFAISAPWGQVIEVLRHEMAHQYVVEILGEHHETAHGPRFRETCRARGIDARAAGLPAHTDPAEDKLIRRIRALLRLAQSPEQHEAAAAARAARRLLAQHDLSLEDPAEVRTFQQVGPTKGRFDPWEKLLGGILGEHFGVQVIYVHAYRPRTGKWGRVLEVLGPAHHVEIAAYVHDVLRQTGESLWRTHKRAAGLPGNTERRRFLYGVMAGFREALATDLEPAETSLVQVDDRATATYVRRRHPRLRTGRRRSVRVSAATEQGRVAGRQIQLRPGVGATEAPIRRITRRDG